MLFDMVLLLYWSIYYGAKLCIVNYIAVLILRCVGGYLVKFFVKKGFLLKKLGGF